VILKIDLICNRTIANLDDILCFLFEKWFASWVEENLHRNARIFINVRDFYDEWLAHPERIGLLVLVAWPASRKRRFADLLFEDPAGNSFSPLLAAKPVTSWISLDSMMQ
jgi:hypothetical protein